MGDYLLGVRGECCLDGCDLRFDFGDESLGECGQVWKVQKLWVESAGSRVWIIRRTLRLVCAAFGVGRAAAIAKRPGNVGSFSLCRAEAVLDGQS